MNDAVERFEELLEQDQHDAEVQYQLGLCYLNGDGTEQDGQKAEKWLRLAADQGHPEAEALLSTAASSPAGLPPLTAATLPEWCMAAEEGDADAQCQVAVYFLDQYPPETEEALRYLKASAGQGNAQACLLLAKQLLPTDPSTAVTYLRNAADCNLPGADRLLAQCYANGRGVAQDPEKAEQYFVHSAQIGGSDEMIDLAVRFAAGNGVPSSMGKAMRWVHQAQSAGEPRAQELFRARYDSYLEDQAAQQAEEARRREAEAQAERLRQAEQRRLEEERERAEQEERQRRAEQERAQAEEWQRRMRERREAEIGRQQMEWNERIKRCDFFLFACPVITLLSMPIAAWSHNMDYILLVWVLVQTVLPLAAFTAANMINEMQPGKRYFKFLSPKGIAWITVVICWNAVLLMLVLRHFAGAYIDRTVRRILE